MTDHFTLLAAETSLEGDAPLPELPDGMPETFLGAGLLLNHSLVAGELLSLDTSEAQWVVDAQGRMSEDFDPVYTDDDVVALHAYLAELAAVLWKAVDSDGRPRMPRASGLAVSPLLEAYPDGSLIFRSHLLPVADLRAELPALVRFFAFAAEQGLWMRIEWVLGK